MDKKTIDYNFGIKKEIYFIDKLKNKFGDNVVAVSDKYCSYDFKNDDCIFELKSRRVLKRTYETTMIGMNKITEYKKMNKRIILCFSFIDKDCYYEYNDTDKIDIHIGGRSDRGKNEYNDYLYIPVDLLIDF